MLNLLLRNALKARLKVLIEELRYFWFITERDSQFAVREKFGEERNGRGTKTPIRA
jgi:hypothetical protein